MNSNKTDIMGMVNLSRKYHPSQTFAVYGLLTNKFYPGMIQDFVKAGMGKAEIESRIAHYTEHFSNDAFEIEYIIEKDGDKVAGFLIMCNPKVEYPGNKKGGQIEVILVAPEYRGKGIGRKLMDEAIERFDKKGRNQLKVDSEWEAVKFYAKFGFKEKVGKPSAFRVIERFTEPFVEMFRIPDRETGEVFCC
jgi:GNAT superfamily N-acetyltransferase